MSAEIPTAGESAIDLQNQSTITTITAITDKDGTNSSPPTSPITLRIDTEKKENYDRQFSDSVTQSSEELISIMKQISQNIKVDDKEGLDKLEEQCKQRPENFDWKKIIEAAETIFSDYSKKMEGVTKDFEDLNRDFLIWQEAVYIMDSEKISKRLGDQENWLHQKEKFLNYQKQELSNSAELIDNALKKLRTGNKE